MAEKSYIPRLKTQFEKTIRPKLVEQFGYSNPFAVPRLDKVVLNMGVGEGAGDQKKVTAAAERSDRDCRPEVGHHEVPQGDRELQAARTHRRSARRSRCAATACTNSSIVW